MKQYYIKPLGYLGDMRTGLILNVDGSVYTGNMKDNNQPSQELHNANMPKLAYEAVNVHIDGSLEEQTIDLLFTQKNMDESATVTAAIRMGSAEEVEKFLVTIMERMQEFRADNRHGHFKFEENREKSNFF